MIQTKIFSVGIMRFGKFKRQVMYAITYSKPLKNLQFIVNFSVLVVYLPRYYLPNTTVMF